MSINYDDRIDFKSCYIGFCAATCIFTIVSKFGYQKQKSELTTKEYTCNVLIVENGEAYRRDNVTKKGTNDETFEVSYQDEQTLVIYVYEEDESERKAYTDYIASNITIGEDNQVYFDIENINEDGYEAYLASIINSNEEKVLKKAKKN